MPGLGQGPGNPESIPVCHSLSKILSSVFSSGAASSPEADFFNNSFLFPVFYFLSYLSQFSIKNKAAPALSPIPFSSVLTLQL
jgi:hypothetical protein